MPAVTPFCLLTHDLVLQISSFLPARDLLEFHCASREFSRLDTGHLWKDLCEKRWKPWPRYRLTANRLSELDTQIMPNTSWKDRYRRIEVEATCNTLEPSHLLDLRWYLSFALSGVRGESRSDFLPVQFFEETLDVPGYPPLPYALVNEPPPSSPVHIRPSQRGEQPFSTREWLRISDFPPHFITRQPSNAEWLIVNENVTFISTKKD